MWNEIRWNRFVVGVFEIVLYCLCLQSLPMGVVRSQDKTGDGLTQQIESWIEQLNEPSLTKRRKAKELLVKADVEAIPFLAKAALSDKRELIVYSLEVLGTLLEKSPSEETRKAAKITLEMLSGSDQPSTSDRAKQILGSKSGDEIEAFPGWDDPKSGFGGGFGVKRSVSASNTNGIKTIRIEEDGKVTTFRDEPRNAIRVMMEEGGNRKEFVAKNVGDLKKKDPEAHALYEQHSKGLGGPMMGFGNGFPAGGAAANGFNNAFGGGFGGNQQFGGFGPNQFQGMNGFHVQQVQGGVGVAGNAGNVESDAAAKEMMIRQLEDLKKRLADNPAMAQMLDSQIQLLKADASAPKK